MSFLFLVYDNKGLTAYYRIDTGFGQGDFGVLGGKKTAHYAPFFSLNRPKYSSNISPSV